jgi:hypothetical protein
MPFIQDHGEDDYTIKVGIDEGASADKAAGKGANLDRARTARSTVRQFTAVRTCTNRIDKKASLTNSKMSDQKTAAEETSSRAMRGAGAEGATAPETLRPTDRLGMTLWKAAFR